MTKHNRTECTGCIYLDVWRNEITKNHWPRCICRDSIRYRQFVTDRLNGCGMKQTRAVGRRTPEMAD